MKPSAQRAIAGAVAVVTVSAAAVVLMQDRSTTIKRITDASPAAPGVAWVTEVSASGIDGATFSDPRTGSMYPWGPGSIRIDDMLLTLAVAPDGDGMNSDAVMVAVETASGAVMWTSPAFELASCAEQPLDGMLVCYRPSYGEQPGLVTFDLSTGASNTIETAPEIVAATVANDRLYIAEGDLEGADVTLHRGTLDDYDADWSTPIAVSAGWEDQYADRLMVGPEVGSFDVGGSFATFDAQTGEEIWSTDILDDCMIAQYRTAGDLAVASDFDCDASSSATTGSTALNRSGEELATYSGPAEHYLSIDEPADLSIPIVLGDTAFDRTTGQELWRNDLLVFDDTGDEYNEPRTRGTLVALVGDVGILRFDDNTVGIDLRTGGQLWTSAETWSLMAHDRDSVVAYSDGALVALDSHTGHQLWSAEFAKMTGDPGTSFETYVGGGGGTYILQSGSTLAELSPLPS
ncbi:PQQ-binding-like beta-propeller repeat protein [Rhodococcus sovatensis]|uniref:PQQ-binding-like beta-propeller repeat protein n=1 Tax=Rhodococcus sovatensis TaxID=1805840 RepID=A0ABZ2PRG5_9NOCA